MIAQANEKLPCIQKWIHICRESYMTEEEA